MPVLRSPFAGGDLPGDADPDYLYFLEYIRLDGDSYTLELPAHGDSSAKLIKYEAPLVSSSDGECVSNPSPGCVSSNRSAVEERESSESAPLETAPAWYDSLDDVDEDYRLFLKHSSLVDGQLVLEIGGVVVNYDEPVAAVSQGERDAQLGEEAAFASPGDGVSVVTGSDEVASGAPATVVPEQNASDRSADPSPRREVNGGGDEELSDANKLKGAYREDGRRAGRPTNSVASGSPVTVIQEQNASNRSADPSPRREVNGSGDEGLSDANKLKGAYREDGRRAGRPTNSGGKVEKELGIIWPTHITRRPDSDFKQRLIEALTKPVAPKEYFRLFDTVTLRTPLMKLRQIRNETKSYPAEQMGKSYLDHYPDLAHQIMHSDRRNGLALMRGFLFWLQNTVHEDQFKPWVDDPKEQEVICLEDSGRTH